MSVRTRIRQGVRALLAFSTPVDGALAAHYLSPTLFELFQKMSRAEQLHSLNVLRDVLAQSTETPADLAVAALMHDVGKSRYHLAVWQKTVSVLTEKFAPQTFAELAVGDTLTRWRAPFMLRLQHPEWGALMLTEAGASPCSIWLVRHHADPLSQWQGHPNAALLARLKAADDAN